MLQEFDNGRGKPVLRVAVVDDEREMRDQLSAFIARFSAEQGADLQADTYSCADELLKDYRPDHDIIIFDIDMPGTSGIIIMLLYFVYNRIYMQLV